ncbi:MAG: bifunctional phosphoglucose/phosphomannose isomerase [Chloroflexi bacterium]|nr:bifunctional phosphoglucose/phosphomannose isomerase [Chloroflexota bacterium]
MDLDDPQSYRNGDPAGMLERLRGLPEQCQQAWQETMRFELPAGYSRIDKVLILGMGGSAIGGDLISSLALEEAPAPVIVHRDYALPAFVDERTLVIASSYSGNTEETLTAFTAALDTPAMKLVATTGGRLRDLAVQAGVPVFTFGYRAQPRAALGFSLLPLLGFLQKLGIIRDKSAEVSETIKVMDDLAGDIGETVPLARNAAKRLAVKLHDRLPVIYGGGITAQVARRWKTQINENSKAWAFWEVFPELNHNAVVGYEFPGELASRIVVVMLRSSLLGERVLKRYDITAEILSRAGVEIEAVDAKGSRPLSQVMSLVFFGDYVSCYLSILYGVDPSPVKVIDYLKDQLAK